MKNLFESKVVYKQNITEDLVIIGFKVKLNFKAGQFFHIILDEKNPNDEKIGFRPYSILNSPTDYLNKGVIYSYIKLIPNGLASEYIRNLKIEDKVFLRGPYGKFLFDTDNNKHIFLCSGTGIAPINSIIDELLVNKNFYNNTHKIILIHSARFKKELLYFDKFFNLSIKNHNSEYLNKINFNYIPLLTKPDNNWNLNRGRINDNKKTLDILKKECESSSVYICGSKEFIVNMLPIVKEKAKNIIIERYN